MAIDLTGAPIDQWQFDLAARTAGPLPRDGAPDATISMGAPVFVMATAGRDRFDELRRSGDLSITGDEPAAEAFLARVRIV